MKQPTMRLYWDERGYPRADVAEPFKALGYYLEGDVQSLPTETRELIELVDEVKRRNPPRWEGTGNAFTLILTPEKARIESEFADPPQLVELPLESFRSVLVQWLALLQTSQ